MEIQPLKRTDVQRLGVNFIIFGAEVPKQMTKKELVDKKLWANVASQFVAGCEIRVTDVSNSFMSRLYITYANQHTVVLKVLEYHVFEDTTVEDTGDHYIKLRGVHKWCIMRKEYPDPIMQDIATKHEAEKQLEEYLNTLAR